MSVAGISSSDEVDTVTESHIASGLQTIARSLYVALLPTVPLDTLPEVFEDRRCALCITTYDPKNEDPVQLPCTHTYDRDCINEWLSEEKAGKNTCPTCRRLLFEHDANLLFRRPLNDEDQADLPYWDPDGTELQRLERELEERLDFVFEAFTRDCVRDDFELYDELRCQGADLPQRNILRNGLELSVHEELMLFAELRRRNEAVLRSDVDGHPTWIVSYGIESFSLRNISGTWSHDDNAMFCEEASRNLLREALNSGADLNRYGGLIYDLLDLGRP